jgi:hypothetical protein
MRKSKKQSEVKCGSVNLTKRVSASLEVLREPDPAILTAQDRVATWEEVRCATSSWPDRVLELCYTKGTHCEIPSELGGTIRYSAEEFEFFACLSDMEGSAVN